MSQQKAIGIINRNDCYTKQAFKRVTGIGEDAWASCISKGLRATRVAGRVHILGGDWHEFIRTRSDHNGQREN
ncbi:hypothetical protein OAG56_03410 [Mariniblastus sp.]|nr:hypothetical protein [Mariniblastus sp.]MDB4756395.1 hypothetical protein [Mariniblastus sp.]